MHAAAAFVCVATRRIIVYIAGAGDDLEVANKTGVLSDCVHIDPKLITSYILMKPPRNVTLVIIYCPHDDDDDNYTRHFRTRNTRTVVGGNSGSLCIYTVHTLYRYVCIRMVYGQ